jgi:hypothetical protein
VGRASEVIAVNATDSDAPRPPSPLEAFLRDYLETVGGAWDEVEPEVYDVLLPPEVGADGANVVRLTFAPEALPEHPGSQLASFGTPLIDRLLGDAVRRGRSALFYLVGLNLAPHNLAGRLRAGLQLAAPLELRVERVRALHFAQAVYWFRAEFVSDQREQTLVPVAIDLHYGREVRHLEALLHRARLAAEPAQPLPEARRQSVAAGHALAREQALRTIAALANVRGRALAARRDVQVERVSAYYADLRGELEEQARRGRHAEEAAARLEERRAAIDREEQLRVAELRQKSNLRVEVRLMQMLLVQQPKLLAYATLGAEKQPGERVELVWDPLLEALEAVPCPGCGRPTFAFERDRLGHAACPACASKPAPKRAGR